MGDQRVHMRIAGVDIDDELIEQARGVLGTSSVKETVEAALRAVLRVDARRQEVRALTGIHGKDLANNEVMAKAWRS